MNAHVTTGIRELTAQELGEVTGGARSDFDTTAAVFAGILTVTVGTVVGLFLDWLFG
jgi:hypothetical protein